MNVIYKMKKDIEPITITSVTRCGMLAAHTEAVYVRLENGVETFIPLDSLEWYNVKEDGANNAVD